MDAAFTQIEDIYLDIYNIYNITVSQYLSIYLSTYPILSYPILSIYTARLKLRMSFWKKRMPGKNAQNHPSNCLR